MAAPPITTRDAHAQHWGLGQKDLDRADGPASVIFRRNLPPRQQATVLRWFSKDRLLRAVWIGDDFKVNLAESVLSQRFHTRS